MSENKSLNNISNMLKDPKQRSIVAILGIIGVIAIGFGFWNSNKTKTQKSSQEAAGAYVAKAPSMEVVPGSSSNLEYNKQVQVKNEKDGEKALEENKSFLPTLTNDTSFSNVSPIDQLDQQLKLERQQQEEMKKQEEPVVEAPPPPPPPEPVPEPVIEVPPPPPPVIIEPPPVVVAPPVQMVVQRPKPKYGAEDALLIATLSEVWKNKASASEFDYARAGGATAGVTANPQVSEGMVDQGANTGTQASGIGAIPISKAGDIHVAVLETGVNSDEPSPILAKIVSGPLKGTRLIGSINVTGEKVVLAFTTASIPRHPKSVGIQAVAIDANTSRTALATSVDNHYFLKYGVLLGATFLGGYADALTNNNKTTIVQNGQVIQIPDGGMNTKELTQQGLGSVGKELANQAKQTSQALKPTITVDSGTAMGILILSDFVIANQ